MTVTLLEKWKPQISDITKREIDKTDRLIIGDLQKIQREISIILNGEQIQNSIIEFLTEVQDKNEHTFIQVGMLHALGIPSQKETENLKDIIDDYGTIKIAVSNLIEMFQQVDAPEMEDTLKERFEKLIETIKKLGECIDLINDSLSLVYTKKSKLSENHVTSIRSYKHTLSKHGKQDKLEERSSNDIMMYSIPHYLSLVSDSLKYLRNSLDPAITQITEILQELAEKKVKKIEDITTKYESIKNHIAQTQKTKEKLFYTDSIESQQIQILVSELNASILSIFLYSWRPGKEFLAKTKQLPL